MLSMFMFYEDQGADFYEDAVLPIKKILFWK